MSAYNDLKRFLVETQGQLEFDFDKTPEPEPELSQSGKLSTSEAAMVRAIETLEKLGYAEDGRTAQTSGRIITYNSYPLPGKTINLGGRLRFKHKNGNDYATVGKKTVFLFKKNAPRKWGSRNGPPEGLHIPTGEVTDSQIREFIDK